MQMLNFLTSLYVCQSLRSCSGPHCQRPTFKMHGIMAEYIFGRGQICQIIINNFAADQLLQLQWKSNTAKVKFTDKFGDALSLGTTLSLWRRVRFHSDSVFTHILIPRYFFLKIFCVGVHSDLFYSNTHEIFSLGLSLDVHSISAKIFTLLFKFTLAQTSWQSVKVQLHWATTVMNDKFSHGHASTRQRHWTLIVKQLCSQIKGSSSIRL